MVRGVVDGGGGLPRAGQVHHRPGARVPQGNSWSHNQGGDVGISRGGINFDIQTFSIYIIGAPNLDPISIVAIFLLNEVIDDFFPN